MLKIISLLSELELHYYIFPIEETCLVNKLFILIVIGQYKDIANFLCFGSLNVNKHFALWISLFKIRLNLAIFLAVNYYKLYYDVK